MSRMTTRSSLLRSTTTQNDENVQPTLAGKSTGFGLGKTTAAVKPVATSRPALTSLSRPTTILEDHSARGLARKPADPISARSTLSTIPAAGVFSHAPVMQAAPSIPEPTPMVDEKEHTGFDMEYECLEPSMGDLSVSSVDIADSNNPLACADLIKDIMAHLKSQEVRRAPSPTYMTKQTDINAKMREILIDWLVEVHLKFRLQSETLYLCVNYIDRFLERRQVSRTKLQLVGCAAMLVAAKYEEMYPPEVRHFVFISDKAYTKDQILSMEQIMLGALEFNLTVPTALRFLERWAKVARLNDSQKFLAHYLLELTLQEYRFLQYLPSQAAAAAVYLALLSTGAAPWTITLQAHTGYTEASLLGAVNDLYALGSVEAPKFTAVRKKYSAPKYLSASTMRLAKPAGTA